jgi:hypothetical protein
MYPSQVPFNLLGGHPIPSAASILLANSFAVFGACRSEELNMDIIYGTDSIRKIHYRPRPSHLIFPLFCMFAYLLFPKPFLSCQLVGYDMVPYIRPAVSTPPSAPDKRYECVYLSSSTLRQAILSRGSDIISISSIVCWNVGLSQISTIGTNLLSVFTTDFSIDVEYFFVAAEIPATGAQSVLNRKRMITTFCFTCFTSHKGRLYVSISESTLYPNTETVIIAVDREGFGHALNLSFWVFYSFSAF